MLDTLKNLKEKVTRPVVNEGLQFWREKIYSSLSLALVIIGLLAYIPSIYLSVNYKLWSVVILDTIVYLFIVCLFFLKGLPYKIRVFGLLIIVYTLGVGLLLFLGFGGAGLVWLFSFPVFGSILKGVRCSVIAISINALTLLTLGLLLHFDLMPEGTAFSFKIESWTIISINFICLNVLVSMPIAVLLDGLETTIEREMVGQVQLKQEQEALQSRNEDLKRINSDLDNFVYIASHDLKAPINNIEGLVDALQRELKEKGETDHIIDMIRVSTDRFKKTILSLTEVTKAQRNEEEDREQQLNIGEIFREVTFNLHDLIKEQSAQIETSFEVDSIHYFRKDLTSIFYNLLSNAIKYRSSERQLVISVASGIAKDNWVFISVKDNGLGMQGNFKEKIFRMFTRLHDHVQGSGVGLYIIKRIVENHGGRVEVSSEINKGSVFTLYLKKKRS
jgi:signal transduction histidine kinase